MINVYDENMKIIANVDYNNNLDVFNGSNWQSGGIGLHKGITKLEDGKLVLIHGIDWEGREDYAEIISKEEALQEILKSGDLDLIDEFDLRGLYEEKLLKEKKTWATKTIKVPVNIYERLTEHKRGNDSYWNVINCLLDFYEEHKD